MSRRGQKQTFCEIWSHLEVMGGLHKRSSKRLKYEIKMHKLWGSGKIADSTIAVNWKNYFKTLVKGKSVIVSLIFQSQKSIAQRFVCFLGQKIHFCSYFHDSRSNKCSMQVTCPEAAMEMGLASLLPMVHTQSQIFCLIWRPKPNILSYLEVKRGPQMKSN